MHPRRRSTILVIGGAVVVAGLAAAITTRGERPRPEAAAATVVRAASGPAGVVMLRDGTVIRMDQQSPPGRLVLPPPTEGPQPDGLAVGRQRVWVSYDGLVRGYGQGGRTVRAFRVSDGGGPLIMAEGGRVLWAGRRDSDILRSANLARRPAARRATLLPVAMRGLTATSRGAWVVGADGEASLLMHVRTGGESVRRVSRLQGAPLGISAGSRTVWVLTTRGLYRIDHRTREVRGPIGVPAGASEVAAGPGRVLVTVPPAGTVLERTLVGRRTTHDIGPGVRGLAADVEGFWVSVGDRATPRRFSYADGSG